MFLPIEAETTGRIGIDAELCTRKVKLKPLIRKALSPGERQQLQSEQTPCREQSFLRLWTLKEAWRKAVGLSVQANMARAEFRVRHNAIQMTSRHTGGAAREALSRLRVIRTIQALQYALGSTGHTAPRHLET